MVACIKQVLVAWNTKYNCRKVSLDAAYVGLDRFYGRQRWNKLLFKGLLPSTLACLGMLPCRRNRVTCVVKHRFRLASLSVGPTFRIHRLRCLTTRVGQFLLLLPTASINRLALLLISTSSDRWVQWTVPPTVPVSIALTNLWLKKFSGSKGLILQAMRTFWSPNILRRVVNRVLTKLLSLRQLGCIGNRPMLSPHSFSNRISTLPRRVNLKLTMFRLLARRRVSGSWVSYRLRVRTSIAREPPTLRMAEVTIAEKLSFRLTLSTV